MVILGSLRYLTLSRRGFPSLFPSCLVGLWFHPCGWWLRKTVIGRRRHFLDHLPLYQCSEALNQKCMYAWRYPRRWSHSSFLLYVVATSEGRPLHRFRSYTRPVGRLNWSSCVGPVGSEVLRYPCSCLRSASADLPTVQYPMTAASDYQVVFTMFDLMLGLGMPLVGMMTR